MIRPWRVSRQRGTEIENGSANAELGADYQSDGNVEEKQTTRSIRSVCDDEY